MADSNVFDWRGYARQRGLSPMHAWIAIQREFRSAHPHASKVTSPQSLDALAADETMHDLIRAVIDDTTDSA